MKLSPIVLSTKNAEHYIWGGHCDGWFLIQTEGLSVITERMPPGSSEVRHHHIASCQLFYVITGTLTMEVEQDVYEIHPNESIAIFAGRPHQAFNQGTEDVIFLVVSQPASQGDRVLD